MLSVGVVGVGASFADTFPACESVQGAFAAITGRRVRKSDGLARPCRWGQRGLVDGNQPASSICEVMGTCPAE